MPWLHAFKLLSFDEVEGGRVLEIETADGKMHVVLGRAMLVDLAEACLRQADKIDPKLDTSKRIDPPGVS